MSGKEIKFLYIIYNRKVTKYIMKTYEQKSLNHKKSFRNSLISEKINL